ncbi:MAG TPA: dethiobiotin synthase [Sphingomonas sp.]|nr:dethiobiotin synthase [Sphingomonas sp.]
MTRRFVVTGTDTDIGKTVFAAGLVRLLDGAYWKPVQAGMDDGTDSTRVAALAGLSPERVLPEAYRLATPCSPHAAAAAEQVAIDPARLAPPATDRPLVIEGAGGALVPLSETLLYADLFARWHEPAIVVASTRLGTINHSLLTIEALRSRGVPVHGIAFVGDTVPESERIICAIGKIRRLGRLPHLDPLTPDTLAAAFAQAFRAEDFA